MKLRVFSHTRGETLRGKLRVDLLWLCAGNSPWIVCLLVRGGSWDAHFIVSDNIMTYVGVRLT